MEQRHTDMQTYMKNSGLFCLIEKRGPGKYFSRKRRTKN